MQKTFNPDGGISIRAYDIFGNLRTQTDEIGKVTEYFYDDVSRLVRTERHGGSYDEYVYDELGRRIKHENALGYTEKYQYDNQGRITKHISYAGRETTYAYTYLSSTGGIGGWEKRTTNAAGDYSLERLDYFGVVHFRQELTGSNTSYVTGGGHTYNYTYDYAGQLTKQTSSRGQNIDYDYYANGLLKSVVDNTIDSEAYFRYDDDGNRIFESYVKATEGMTGGEPYQLQSAQYDALGRVTQINEAHYSLRYAYDEVGNRKMVSAEYHDGRNNDTKEQTFYYRYDQMNRFVVTMGQLVNGQIVRGTTGYDLDYNAASQRTRAVSTANNGSTIDERYHYDDNGFLHYVTYGTSDVRRAERINDLAGRLKEYRERNANGSITSRHQYTYDNDNIQTKDHDVINNRGVNSYVYADGKVNYTQTYGGDAVVTQRYYYSRFDDYKQARVNISASHDDIDGWKPGNTYYTYDVNGHLTLFRDRPTGEASRDMTYVNNHMGQILQRRDNTQIGTEDERMYTRHFYYLNGAMVGDVGNDSGDFKTDYAQLLRQKELEGDRNKKHIARQEYTQSVQYRNNVIAQQALYDSGFGGGSRYSGGLGEIIYRQSLSKYQHQDIPKRATFVTSADFDQNYQPISPTYPGATSGSYEVRSGDTLQSIAQSMFGDAAMWYIIADANGLTGDEALTPGQRLTIPNVVTNIHNSADTFRPYDPGYAIGDTTPTLPEAPKQDDGCGVIGMIIMVIVAVVVTYFTAGALTGYFVAAAAQSSAAMAVSVGAYGLGGAAVAGAGGVAAAIGSSAIATGVIAGAVGAAAGSIASQAVGMAMGNVKEFSWNQVGVSAITGGVMGGLSGWASTASQSNAAANVVRSSIGNAMIRNVVNQSANRLMGEQDNFSWSSFATSAVSSAVSSAAGSGINKWNPTQSAGLNDVLEGTAVGLIAGTASAGIQLARGEEVSWKAVAADALGNAIGESITAASHRAAVKEQVVDLAPELADSYDAFVAQDGSPESFLRMVSNPQVRSGLVASRQIRSEAEVLLESGVSPRDAWNHSTGSQPNSSMINVNGESWGYSEVDPNLGMRTLGALSEVYEGYQHVIDNVPAEELALAVKVALFGPGAAVADYAMGKIVEATVGDYLSQGLDVASTAIVGAAHEADYESVNWLLENQQIFEMRLDQMAAESDKAWGAYFKVVDEYDLSPAERAEVDDIFESEMARFDQRWDQEFKRAELTKTLRSEKPGGVLLTTVFASMVGVAATKFGNADPKSTTLVREVDKPDVTTGVGYGVNNPPVRIEGEWSRQDYFNALNGRTPGGLGRPDLHHADQMPGSAIHEVLPSEHRGNSALHPNGKRNQGVTPEMRRQDKELHWWYRARENGADEFFPDWIYDNVD